jgi:hypothetical protein
MLGIARCIRPAWPTPGVLDLLPTVRDAQISTSLNLLQEGWPLAHSAFASMTSA